MDTEQKMLNIVCQRNAASWLAGSTYVPIGEAWEAKANLVAAELVPSGAGEPLDVEGLTEEYPGTLRIRYFTAGRAIDQAPARRIAATFNRDRLASDGSSAVNDPAGYRAAVNSDDTYWRFETPPEVAETSREGGLNLVTVDIEFTRVQPAV